MIHEYKKATLHYYSAVTLHKSNTSLKSKINPLLSDSLRKKKKSKISSHTVTNGLRRIYVLIMISPLQIQISPGLSLTVTYWQVDHIKDWIVGTKWPHMARFWSMNIKSNTSLLQCCHSSQKQQFTKVKNQSSIIWFFKKRKSKISGHTVSNGLRWMYVLIVVSPLQIQISPGLSLTVTYW